jgi:hypothetical protein
MRSASPRGHRTIRSDAISIPFPIRIPVPGRRGIGSVGRFRVWDTGVADCWERARFGLVGAPRVA